MIGHRVRAARQAQRFAEFDAFCRDQRERVSAILAGVDHRLRLEEHGVCFSYRDAVELTIRTASGDVTHG